MTDQNHEMPLVILEVANNHMGSVAHGRRLIEALAVHVMPYRDKFNFAVKFQFRQLDTFIHPDYRGSDLKFVKRFEETRLSSVEWDDLISAVRENNLLLIATPFDEDSVDKCLHYDVDYIKIASCSSADWPLVERVAKAQKPVIFSTAGASLNSIDSMVAFFSNREVSASLMHCVGLYPTPRQNLNIGQIAFYKKRYPHLRIGYSTHEDPSFIDTGALALALGARIFEKHVGIESDDFQNNAYSGAPEQIANWLEETSNAISAIGLTDDKVINEDQEVTSLRDLQRGVFVKRDVGAGIELTADDVYFAIPNKPGDFVANDFSKYTKFTTIQPIKANTSANDGNAVLENFRVRVQDIVDRLRALMSDANITFPQGRQLEISHHFGVENFFETGLAMVTIVNEEYCKKLLFILPGQAHPEQLHKKKKETFHIVYGALSLVLDGQKIELRPGETITIEPGVRHEFWSESGCVIEELSSTHHRDDSFYTDVSIQQNTNRKTLVNFWQ